MITSTCVRRLLCATALTWAALICLPLEAAAQAKRPQVPKDPKWTIEVFGGIATSPGAGDGDGAVEFPSGTPFTTFGGFTSRSVPSWFFGDGATLFNQVAGQFSAAGVNVPNVVPLDSMLGRVGAQAKAGTSFGARLTRRLTPRFALEFAVQRSRADLELTGAARDAIDQSSASFQSGFNALLATLPTAGLQVTSAVEFPSEGDTSETVVSGALKIDMVRSGRLGVYATAGAGWANRSAGALEARLRGNYQFRLFDVQPVAESDIVTIRFESGTGGAVGVFGGGVTYDVGRRHGLRADFRVHAGPGEERVRVEAAPSIVRTGTPLVLPSATNPSIQFSNISGAPTSLGATLPRRETFSSDDLIVRPHLTLSYFFRF